jgi:hypothetical protein
MGNQAALRRLSRNVPAGPPIIQCKLEVGAVDDPLEAEADRVADHVMRMSAPAPPVSNNSHDLDDELVHRKCAGCEEEEKNKKLNMKSNGHPAATGEAPPIVDQALSGVGHRLDASTRAFYEPRFGADLGGVRVHTDSLARQSASAVNARAFAAGNHIVLGPGASAGVSPLLAHELAHVVQNGAAPPTGTLRRNPEDVPQMDAQLKTALAAAPPDWATAARVLNGYSPDDMLTRLAPLTSAQRDSIHKASLTAAGVGPDSRVAELTDPSFQNAAGAHFYTSDNFDNRFDGVVDPTMKTVTLLFRVKFEFADGLHFGAALPGTPNWEQETAAGEAKFKTDFKSVVESTWSGKGTIHPRCAIAGVNQLATKVVVDVVESGQHTTFRVSNLGSSDAAVQGNRGQLDVDDNTSQKKTGNVADPTGRIPTEITTEQVASTHEFGHAIGLPHVHCDGGGACYGVTEQERKDVMGVGSVVQAVSRNGAVTHDDFVPFERIATRWGKDAAGAQANCNVWSATQGS